MPVVPTSAVASNEELLLAFYSKHAPGKATSETVRHLLRTYTAAQISDGLIRKYGATIKLQAR